jgi:hypothetical protein
LAAKLSIRGDLGLCPNWAVKSTTKDPVALPKLIKVCDYCKMSITPITQRSYEYLHDKVRNDLIDKVLPQVFPTFLEKLKAHDTYPVVLGGTLVQRCAKRSARAHWFVRDLLTEDVDIKMVITRETTGVETDAIYKKLDVIRQDVIKEVVRKLKPFLAKLENDGLSIETGINESLLKARNVLSLEISYIEANDVTARRVTLPLLDINFFSDTETTHYHKFRKLFPEIKLPIPYIKHKGVLYATCNYAYYDTVRMMVERLRYFQEKKTMFGLMKFSRYVLKFMCLHTLLKSTPDMKIEPKLKDIYSQVNDVLKTIDIAKLSFADAMKTQYNEQYITNIARLLTLVVHTTHIEELITFIDASVPTQSKIKIGGKTQKTKRDGLKSMYKRLDSIVQGTPPTRH